MQPLLTEWQRYGRQRYLTHGNHLAYRGPATFLRTVYADKATQTVDCPKYVSANAYKATHIQPPKTMLNPAKVPRLGVAGSMDPHAPPINVSKVVDQPPPNN
jgi:hypothetical protein